MPFRGQDSKLHHPHRIHGSWAFHVQGIQLHHAHCPDRWREPRLTHCGCMLTRMLRLAAPKAASTREIRVASRAEIDGLLKGIVYTDREAALNVEHGCREQCTGMVTLSHLPETVRADHVFLRKELIAELLEETTPGICGRLARLAWFSLSRGASRSVERNM